MTEETKSQQDVPADSQGHKQTSLFTVLSRIVFVVLVVAAVALFVFNNPKPAGRILLVALGFGGVVMIHELGHFLFAKLGGIKVEAFAIGFPPLVLGIRKLKKGIRFRLFPSLDDPGPVEPGDHETEYCIGLIPMGGFVKMLGQSDSGPAQQSSDPRSYLNRPIWIRVVVVAAGVVFNAIAAMALFIGLFLHGVRLAPPVVGQVVSNSPAEVAGFQPGDRVLEIDGKQFLDYASIMLAGALSGDNKQVQFVVRHSDGQIETIKAVAEKCSYDGLGLKSFGIVQASSLTVSRFEDPNDIEFLYKETGLRPDDVITAFNGTRVNNAWQMNELVEKTFAPSAVLTVSRCWPKGSDPSVAEVTVPMMCEPAIANFRSEYDLAGIYSMAPRLKVFIAYEAPLAPGVKLKNWLLRCIGKPQLQKMPPEPVLKKGDVLLKVGDVANPTYRELREQTIAHKDKELPVVVLRKAPDGNEKELTVSISPRTQQGKNGRVVLDIVPELDMDRPVVARTIDSATGPAALTIPSGAMIISIDGRKVNSFYDIVKILRSNAGQRIGIEYRDADGDGGVCGLTVPEHDAIRAFSDIAVALPLDYLKEPYRAQTAAQAVNWGAHRTWQLIAQSYLTLKKLLTSRDVPTSSLAGPVGIISMSYRLAGQGLTDFLYFLGLLSSIIAVMNLLPIPVLDGGAIVLLLIEKIKGRPLSEKVQQALVYGGMVLLLTLVLWVTYNDIQRLLFG